MLELVQKEEAEKILEQYLPIFNQVLLDSLKQLNNGISAIDVILNNTAKAMMMHSIAVEKTKMALGDNEGLLLLQKYQTIQIVFAGKLAGRIKKLGKNGLPAKSTTWRNKQIVSQQYTLFDLPPLTFIDFGYRIDPSGTQFEKLLVVCRLNDDVLWNIPFDDFGTDALDVTIKSTPITPKPIETEKQITVKKNNG